MNEIELKVELLQNGESIEEYLQGLMDFRLQQDDGMEEDIAVIARGVSTVNAHLSQEMIDGKITVVDVPKTKEELAQFMRKIDFPSDEENSLGNGFNPKKSMDLRVSASEEKMKAGVSIEDRLKFLQNINQDQESFREKMERLRVKEKRRKDLGQMKKLTKFERQKQIHHEEAVDNYKKSLSDIKARQVQRERGKKEYQQLKKLHELKKPEYIKIRESYERDVLGGRNDLANNILRQRKNRYQSVNYDDLEEHMKKYDASRRIQNFKSQKKYGITGMTPQLKTGERHFQNMVRNKEKDEKFQQLLRRREASMKYAEEVCKINILQK